MYYTWLAENTGHKKSSNNCHLDAIAQLVGLYLHNYSTYWQFGKKTC